MGKTVSNVVEAAFAAIAMFILFAIVFAAVAGCYLITVAATDFIQVLQTPPPF